MSDSVKNEKVYGLCKKEERIFRIASCYRILFQNVSDEERFCRGAGGRVTLIESEIDILKENDMYR